MNVNITNKTEEPLLSRLKVEGSVSFDKETPSANEVQASIAKSVGKDAKLVVVDKIGTAYGKQEATIVSYVYENEDMISKATKLGKKRLEAIKKAEEEKEEKKASSEQSSEQAPAEEAKTKEAEEKAASTEEKADNAPAEESAKEEEKPAEEAKDEKANDKKEEEPKAEEKPEEKKE